MHSLHGLHRSVRFFLVLFAIKTFTGSQVDSNGDQLIRTTPICIPTMSPATHGWPKGLPGDPVWSASLRGVLLRHKLPPKGSSPPEDRWLHTLEAVLKTSSLVISRDEIERKVVNNFGAMDPGWPPALSVTYNPEDSGGSPDSLCGLQTTSYIRNFWFDLPGRRNWGSIPASFIQQQNKERHRESCLCWVSVLINTVVFTKVSTTSISYKTC